MVDSLMGGNTQMYYLNGRIDYGGLSPKDVNTEQSCTGAVHSYINRDSTLNMSKTLRGKISSTFVNKRSTGEEERSLIGGCSSRGLDWAAPKL